MIDQDSNDMDIDDSMEKHHSPMVLGSDVSLDDDDADDLDMKNMAIKAWLVKLPKFLFEKWCDIESDDIDLGTVQISNDDLGPGANNIKLILSNIDAHAEIPKEYELQIINQDVKDIYTFYQNKESGAVSLAATVHHNCLSKPILTGDYSRKLRERTMQAGQPRRAIKMMDENENRGAYVPPGSSGAAITKFGNLVQKKQKVSIEQKTTRMPKNELIDLLFSAFELYAYWSLKGLKIYVKQPESYLKEVLSEIATLDKKGQYTNCYHLKSEYSRQAATNESIAPVGLVSGNSGGDNYNDNQFALEPQMGGNHYTRPSSQKESFQFIMCVLEKFQLPRFYDNRRSQD
ncbi:2658_t:CDS:2, partial [Paraglomus occultum]